MQEVVQYSTMLYTVTINLTSEIGCAYAENFCRQYVRLFYVYLKPNARVTCMGYNDEPVSGSLIGSCM